MQCSSVGRPARVGLDDCALGPLGGAPASSAPLHPPHRARPVSSRRLPEQPPRRTGSRCSAPRTSRGCESSEAGVRAPSSSRGPTGKTPPLVETRDGETAARPGSAGIPTGPNALVMFPVTGAPVAGVHAHERDAAMAGLSREPSVRPPTPRRRDAAPIRRSAASWPDEAELRGALRVAVMGSDEVDPPRTGQAPARGAAGA